MKSEVFSKILFSEKKRNNIPFMKICKKQLFNPGTLQSGYFRRNVYIFEHGRLVTLDGMSTSFKNIKDVL